MAAEAQEGRGTEIGSAASRLLNALLGGDGSVTFSAASWQEHLDGGFLAEYRLSFVNWLNSDRNHCYKAWLWHQSHGLL